MGAADVVRALRSLLTWSTLLSATDRICALTSLPFAQRPSLWPGPSRDRRVPPLLDRTEIPGRSPDGCAPPREAHRSLRAGDRQDVRTGMNTRYRVAWLGE